MVKITGHTTRRIIFWSLCTLSAGLLLFLFFFFSGYRFDWDDKKITRLGSLGISTQPRNVTVTLDGEIVARSNPTLVNHVRTGEHMLRLTKDGYRPLEFSVAIQSDTTTLVTDMILVVASEPQVATPPEEQTAVDERGVELATHLRELPIWKISGSALRAVLTGPNFHLTVIRPDESIQAIASHVTDMEWGAGQDLLFYNILGTVWVHEFTSNSPSAYVLTKQSESFVDLAVIPKSNALVMSDSQHITLAQVSPQQDILYTPLVTGTSITQIQMSPDGNTLFYQDNGIWHSLQIQEN